MDIHNTAEDIVLSSVQTIFDAIKKEGNPEGICLCEQCRVDTCCYVLNRVEPRYSSSRGIIRMEMDGMHRQQVEADIATLVYRGLQQVNHNQRPLGSHGSSADSGTEAPKPAFDIPTIVGRLFDGVTFAPLADVKVELRSGGVLVAMRNPSWQNPYTLVPNAPGAFTFWPALISSEAVDIHRIFEFMLKIEAPEYETITHFFKIPVASSLQIPFARTGTRTFKLPDLYMFPPGEAEQNG